MKKVSLLLLIALPFTAWSQAIPTNVRAQMTLDKLTVTQPERQLDNMVMGIPVPPGDVIGHTYLDDTWNVGSVMVADKKVLIESYLMKYDIKDQNIEIKTQLGIRLLAVKNVSHMVWVDSATRKAHYFVNGANYKEDDTPLIGMLEVVVDGPKSLFSRTKVEIKSPTYNVAMDVGSRDTQILKKSAYYYNDASNNVYLIKSKKKFLEGFGGMRDELEKFMKDNRLDLKSEDELVKIFTFINSRSSGSN